jgi:hypothetical protein
MIVAGLLVVLLLLSTDTLSVKCDTEESNVSEMIDDAGDRIEGAANELTED